jgi:hypothetical protein
MANEIKAEELVQGVSGLAKEIGDLAKEIAELRKQFTETQKVFDKSSKSQNDLAKKTKAVSDADKELEKIKKRQLKITKEVVFAQEKEKQRVKELRDEYKKQQGTLKKSGGLFRSMTKSILAASGAMFGLRAAFNVLKKSFKTAVDFSKSMSEVKAITGATNEEFKELKASALTLGATTAKTSSEVSGLQKEFAKLGFSTQEILSATEATINLSIAAGSDLAESATVAASTIRGFGLSATESTRVVDVMAKSFTTSALDLEKFKTAMATVAPVAKASGKDIEFTTAQIAVLADAGLDASTAGTSLRNMFLELNKQGLTWEEGLEKINKSTNKNVTALDLFGKRGATAGLILADNTEKSKELESALDDASGSAKEMADIMADNLAGDITKAGSAWEGFILSISEGSGVINKALRGIIQLSTQALTVLSSMSAFSKDAANLTEQDAEKILTTLAAVGIGVSDEVKKAYEGVKNATKNELIPAFRELRDQLEAQGFSQEKALKIAETAAKKRANELAAAANAQKEAEITAAEETARIKSELAKEEAKKQDEQVQKNIERLKKELAAKEALLLKAKQDSDALADSLVDEEMKLADEEIERLANQLDEEFKLQQEAAKKEIELARATEERKKQIKEAAIDAAGEIVSDRISAGIDDELARFQAGQDAQEEIFQKQLDAKEISEEEFAEKVTALKLKTRQEEAKAEKKKALFDIAIATAVAAVKALPALPLVALVVALGAAQAAVVAAKPIPKFEHGTDGKLQLATDAIVGEAGTELISTPKGDFFSPDTATKVHLPANSQVFPNYSPETQAALNGGMTQEMYEGLVKEQRLTRKAIANQPKHITNLTDSGLEKAYIAKQTKKRLFNEWIKK